MYKVVSVIFLIALLPFSGFAQFNDSVHHQLAYSSTGSINRTNDATAYLLNNSLRYSIRKDDFRFNFNNSWIYGEQTKRQTNNDYVATLDFNLYKTLPHFYYWGLGNYTTSYSLKIDNQVQGGLGAAYNLIDKKNAVLNLSNGILYEQSTITLTDSTKDHYNTFRNSFRIQFRWKFEELFSITGVGFAQNSLNNSDDYILRANLSLSVKLYKWISLTSAYTYNQVSRTKRENMLFTYGITFERFF